MPKRTSRGLSSRIGRLCWITGISWTVIISCLFLRDIKTIQETAMGMAALEAAAHFNMDWASRLWAASHGGVYVPVSDKTPPNPFLKQLPERDIVTPSGRNLTLMNPAYMIRQMMDHYSELYGVLGHITSLKPLRAETSPDDWEGSWLRAFEQGAGEAGEVADIGGQPYFRLMKPLMTEVECLKCHANQGYKVGDIRGGLSVSVPIGPYFASQRKEILTHGISFSILWLLGLSGVAFFGRALMRRAEEHQKTQELYTTVVENSLTGIYLIQGGKIIFANQRFADIFGYSRQEITGMDSLDLVHPDDRPLIRETRERRLEGKGAPEEYEARGLRKDGETIWVQRRNSRILHEGKPAILGNVLDVTALKRAEMTLREYAGEMARKNAELDSFTSIASHDLKEPLRKLKTFSDLLMSKHGGPLDDQGRDYLERMRRTADRMETLINSLLAYSRITTKTRTVERIDLNDVVRDALSDLDVRIAETQGTVQVDPLPEISADRTQMVQLFENLLGNALKFQRKGVPPQIKIAVRADGKGEGAVEIRVQDNGIGFDEKYLGRIFSPFERLHGNCHYEGVGMGLTICRKIVERHSGTITAESTVGKGSVFTVRLPVNPALPESE